MSNKTEISNYAEKLLSKLSEKIYVSKAMVLTVQSESIFVFDNVSNRMFRLHENDMSILTVAKERWDNFISLPFEISAEEKDAFETHLTELTLRGDPTRIISQISTGAACKLSKEIR